MSPETARRFCRRFEPFGFDAGAMTPVYGLAECSVGLAFPPMGSGLVVDRVRRQTFTRTGDAVAAAEDEDALAFVRCGRPLVGHEIRVVDAADREVAERREGRLQFRGPSATGGYFRNAEATKALFHGDWLESGDLAYIAGGDVYVTGRTKDVIIRGGRNIYPAELEEAVGAVDGVRQGGVAVFGSADPGTGTERLVVLAETRKREAGDQERLRAHINALTTDLVGAPPDDVVLAPPNTVLKTSSGKIRRAATREVFERGLVGKPRRAVKWQTTRLALAALAPRARRAAGGAVSVLYAAYAWALLVVAAPPTWLSVALLPRRAWRWAVVRGAVRLLVALSGARLTVQGLDNLPPPGQAFVYACNHTSYLDPLFLIAALPGELAFVAKAELIGNFFASLFLRRLGSVFVERFDVRKGIADARRTAAAAGSGRLLFYFPEGTLTRMPGLLPFHMGAFLNAAEASLPVVPVTIRGTRSILRDGSSFPRLGSVSVVVDAPIAAPADGDRWSAAVKPARRRAPANPQPLRRTRPGSRAGRALGPLSPRPIPLGRRARRAGRGQRRCRGPALGAPARRTATTARRCRRRPGRRPPGRPSTPSRRRRA